MITVAVGCGVAGALVTWLVSPVLGGLLLMGAVFGAGWAAWAFWAGNYPRRTGPRYRG